MTHKLTRTGKMSFRKKTRRDAEARCIGPWVRRETDSVPRIIRKEQLGLVGKLFPVPPTADVNKGASTPFMRVKPICINTHVNVLMYTAAFHPTPPPGSERDSQCSIHPPPKRSTQVRSTLVHAVRTSLCSSVQSSPREACATTSVHNLCREPKQQVPRWLCPLPSHAPLSLPNISESFFSPVPPPSPFHPAFWWTQHGAPSPPPPSAGDAILSSGDSFEAAKESLEAITIIINRRGGCGKGRPKTFPLPDASVPRRRHVCTD